MKILIFGNLASGKTYLSNEIQLFFPNVEYLAIDDFRRKIGDGSMEQELKAKQSFFDSIKVNHFQIIEATGCGDTGETIAQLLAQTNEPKLLYILQTPLKICSERLKSRVWDIPYPSLTTNAFKLLEETDLLIRTNFIQSLWKDAKLCKITIIKGLSTKTITTIIKQIKNETNRNYKPID